MQVNKDNERCQKCMEYMFPEINNVGVSKIKVEILQYLSKLQNEKLELEIMQLLQRFSK